MIAGSKDIVEILKVFFDSQLFNVHTSLPARIVSYDETTGLAEVEPMVRLKKQIQGRNETLTIPTITNVPVMQGSTQDFRIKYPITRGAGCLLVFSEAGIGRWLQSIEKADADDLSRFSLTDGIAIMGLNNIANVPKQIPDIELDTSGVLKLEGGETEAVRWAELMSYLQAITNMLTGINTVIIPLLAVAKGIAPMAITPLEMPYNTSTTEFTQGTTPDRLQSIKSKKVKLT